MKTTKSARLRITPRTLAYIACDVLGLVLLASGIFWLIDSGPLLIKDFPTTRAEAFIALAGGLALMFYAAVGLLRAFIEGQAGEAQKPPAAPGR